MICQKLCQDSASGWGYHCERSLQNTITAHHKPACGWQMDMSLGHVPIYLTVLRWMGPKLSKTLDIWKGLPFPEPAAFPGLSAFFKGSSHLGRLTNVNHLELVGGWPTPLKNMSSSVGKIYIFPIYIYIWNKMKPTNPNAHTYVNGTDVKTHGYEVTHNTFLQSFIWTVLCMFPLIPVCSVEWKV